MTRKTFTLQLLRYQSLKGTDTQARYLQLRHLATINKLLAQYCLPFILLTSYYGWTGLDRKI